MKKTTRFLAALLVIIITFSIFSVAASAKEATYALNEIASIDDKATTKIPEKSDELAILKELCDRLGSDYDMTDILSQVVAADPMTISREAMLCAREAKDNPMVADFMNELAAISQGKQTNQKVTLGQLLEVAEIMEETEHNDGGPCYLQWWMWVIGAAVQITLIIIGIYIWIL